MHYVSELRPQSQFFRGQFGRIVAITAEMVRSHQEILHDRLLFSYPIAWEGAWRDLFESSINHRFELMLIYPIFQVGQKAYSPLLHYTSVSYLHL